MTVDVHHCQPGSLQSCGGSVGKDGSSTKNLVAAHVTVVAIDCSACLWHALSPDCGHGRVHYYNFETEGLHNKLRHMLCTNGLFFSVRNSRLGSGCHDTLSFSGKNKME